MKRSKIKLLLMRAIFLLITLSSSVLVSCTDQGSFDDDKKKLPTMWQKVNDPPVPHPSSYRMSAYDEDREKLVVFGGTTLADTWEYDGRQWREIITPQSPPALKGGCLCYHPVEKKIFLFGGINFRGQTQQQFWAYDGQDWSEISTECLPPARSFSSMCFDSDRECLVLFGGQRGIIQFRDTWEYTSGLWQRVTTTHLPEGRYGHSMVYDPLQKRIILFGGSQFLDSTWSYDGNDWSLIETENSPPPRFLPAMTRDSSSETIILFGGHIGMYSSAMRRDLWQFDGTNWIMITKFMHNNSLKHPFICHVKNQDYFWLFCSYYDWLNKQYSLVYKLQNSILTELPVMESPQPRVCSSTMIYDTSKRRFLLLVPWDKDYLQSSWIYEHGEWGRSEFALPEWPGFCHSRFIYDQARGIPIVIPPQDYHAPSETLILFELKGNQWLKRAFRKGPFMVKSACAYDAERQVLVLFGGKYRNYPYDLSNETWEYNGQEWTHKITKDSPSPRYDATMTYDSDLKKIVLFGGYHGFDHRRDTWVYNGQNWERLHTAHAPENNGPMIYHRGFKKIIMFATRELKKTTWLHFWQYDYLDWQLLIYDQEPCDRYSPTMAYDQHQDRVLFFGGNFITYIPEIYIFDFGDTWELRK